MSTASLQVHVSTAQNGFVRRLLIVGIVLGFIVFTFLKVSGGRAAAASSIIKSGVSGYCLDDYKDSSVVGSKVVSWSCDGKLAQTWSVSMGKITHGSDCLSVQANSKASGALVVMNGCSDDPGQIWLQDAGGYFNPNSEMCLTALQMGRQLTISSCDNGPAKNQTWSAALLNKPGTQSTACSGSEGQLVACYAEREWGMWQSGSISHTDLLTKYTDGTPDEAWCADFISYVYKEAGHPLTQAYDGWDEAVAENLQNYNFSKHYASSGYVPKTGDIAYFNYPGGHVEIVVSGGKNPTFVYGDSATVDPTTGNGQMKANTIVNDGPEGQLVYYLTPN